MISLLLLIVFKQGISIGATQASNRVTAFFMTLNNVVIPLLSMALIFITLCASAQVTELPIIGEKFLPSSLINSLIAVAVLLLGLSLLGITAASQEVKYLIEAHIVLLGICTVGVLIQAAFVT